MQHDDVGHVTKHVYFPTTFIVMFHLTGMITLPELISTLKSVCGLCIVRVACITLDCSNSVILCMLSVVSTA